MTGTTHFAAGLFAGASLALCLHLQPVQGAVVVAGTALGSLFPDIDHKNSTISQKVKPVSTVRQRPLLPEGPSFFPNRRCFETGNMMSKIMFEISNQPLSNTW